MEDLADGKSMRFCGGSMSWVVSMGQGIVRSWKEKIRMKNEKDSEEEVSSKSTLKQYKLAKNGARVKGF